MPRTMRAAVVRAFKKPLVIEEVPVPDPGPGQILVKIAATGVCHTDLHAADGDWPVKPSPPFIPGHEGVGTSSARRRDVKDVKEGDRVGVPWLLHRLRPLQALPRRLGDAVRRAAEHRLLGQWRLRRVRRWPIPAIVGHLPANVGFAAIAPVLCAGVTVYKGLKVTDTKPGDWVVISGIGGLGHMAVQYAKAMGLHVVAVDVDDAKLELAKQARRRRSPSTRAKADPVAVRAGRSAAPTACWSPPSRPRRSRRRSAWWARRHDVARRPAAGRLPARRSSTSCSTARPCAARSSAPAWTCRRRSPSPARARCKATVDDGERWRTSTTSSPACTSGDIEGRIVLDFQG